MNISIPKISIIVPVYNVEKYLKRCVDSLQKQTLQNIEIILVDDGSPDGSPQLCDKLALIDSRIKVIHKKNEGLGFARNSGLEVATGEFAAFVDSDDYVDHTMYEKLYDIAQLYNLDTVFSGGFYRVFNDGRIVPRKEAEELLLFEGEDIYKLLLAEMIGAPPGYSSDVKYTMSACRAIYSTQQIKDYEICFVSEREVLSEDILFNADYLSRSKKVALIPECFYYYCYNEGSLTATLKSNGLARATALYSELKLRAEENDYYHYCKNNIDRLFLRMIRTFIIAEVKVHKKNFKQQRINISAIFNSQILDSILRSYPYTDLPIKHKLFFLCLKFKLRRPLIIILNIIL